jgi:ribosomal protein S18 acetylase RimI-like enzyme
VTGAEPAGRTRGARTSSAPTPVATIERDADVRLRPLSPEHRAHIESLLRETGFFREAEITIALEVIDSYFNRPDQDYSALGAFTPGGDLIGYVCYGPTPCTAGTFDLYWIAVARHAQNTGTGTILLQEVERRLARADARLVIVETSSQPLYAPTRAFYARKGYAEVARVPDFYAEGDDRVIFAKRIQSESQASQHG